MILGFEQLVNKSICKRLTLYLKHSEEESEIL